MGHWSKIAQAYLYVLYHDVVVHLWIDYRLYLALGVAWIILSIVTRTLKAFALGLLPAERRLVVFWDMATIDPDALIPLAAVCIFGFLFFDLVYLAAVANYSIQSEFNIKYIRAVTEMVVAKNQKYSNLDIAIKVVSGMHWMRLMERDMQSEREGTCHAY